MDVEEHEQGRSCQHTAAAAGIDVGGNMAGRPSLEEKNNLRNENIKEKHK